MEKGKDTKKFFTDLIVNRIILVAKDVGAGPYVIRQLGQIARKYADELVAIESTGWESAFKMVNTGTKGQQLIRQSLHGVNTQEDLFSKIGIENLSPKIPNIKAILEKDRESFRPQAWREIQRVLDLMFPSL